MASAALDTYTEWAEKEKADPAHTIIVTGVKSTSHKDTAAIEEVLQQFGAVKVRVVRDGKEEGELEALCIFKGKVSDLLLGETIKATAETEWKVVRLPSATEPDFDAELLKFLSLHNKTLEDVKGLNDLPEGVVKHIHVVQGQQSAYQRQRRLRPFSGKVPVPPGELPFDTWAQHASQLGAETSLSDDERKARLVDSLLPPALTIYRKAVEASGSLTTPEVLVQLGRAFGVACEPGDLLMEFREVYQLGEEAPSAFLTRLEEALDRAIMFGGVDKGEADSLPLSQLIRGCVHSEGLVGALQLRQRKSSPPKFVDLLEEVRVEEAAEEKRSEKRQVGVKSGKKAQTKAATVPSADLEQIKAKVAAIEAASSHAAQSVNSTADELMVELKRLRQELEDVKASSWRSRPWSRSRPGNCYRCGLPGHYARSCRKPPSECAYQGNGRGRPQEGKEAPKH